jgi:hypothetical protein
MHRVGLLESTTASTRCRSAVSLFRLADIVLRGTTGLREKQLIPRVSVCAALSIAGLLQRWVAALHPAWAVPETTEGVGTRDRLY